MKYAVLGTTPFGIFFPPLLKKKKEKRKAKERGQVVVVPILLMKMKHLCTLYTPCT
jgi:hypothetical protein